MTESVSGDLPQGSEEEIGDLSHRLLWSLEEDNSRRCLLSALAEDPFYFFSSIVALK